MILIYMCVYLKSTTHIWELQMYNKGNMLFRKFRDHGNTLD